MAYLSGPPSFINNNRPRQEKSTTLRIQGQAGVTNWQGANQPPISGSGAVTGPEPSGTPPYKTDPETSGIPPPDDADD